MLHSIIEKKNKTVPHLWLTLLVWVTYVVDKKTKQKHPSNYISKPLLLTTQTDRQTDIGKVVLINGSDISRFLD